MKLNKKNIIKLLLSEGEDKKALFEHSAIVKELNIGKITYLRGLIEFSNICQKNCLYCGIRKSNQLMKRFNLDDASILDAVKIAIKNNYSSIVLQSGELDTKTNSDRISSLIEKIVELSGGKLGITLSCGEQTESTYRRWKSSGASRYLLRIETSNEGLYYKIHPKNKSHNFQKRIECLSTLKNLDYQVGTGVMIGLPFQTIPDLADDILFMKDIDIDMCGMGPYIEHKDTPLYMYKNELLPLNIRFELTLKMIASLRILMPDINIAASTAMQAIDKMGREKALKVGANIIMPNLTPGTYRNLYKLYENKPCIDEQAEDCLNCMELRISIAGDKVGYGEFGDSKHFEKRKIKMESKQN